MSYDQPTIWLIIAGLAIGTFLIRYSFIGIIGDRQLPDWVLDHLRYTAVAVLPGLIAPLILWPAATGGVPDASRLAAAAVAFAVGMWRKSVVGAVAGGMVILYLVQYLAG
ncbi:MAG: AzlD domain-containing protein [Rhodobacteraceae bacterium]|nr:AzlD domain-containing protein [Paracoccaceae bacterium]